MNLGAEPKKVVILSVLVVLAIGGLYLNSGTNTPAPVARRTAPVVTTSSTVRSVKKSTKAQTTAQSNGGEFILRVLGSRPDDHPDPTNLDPELKLDLLAKVQAVEPIEAGRNLFQYGAAPPPAAQVKLPNDVPKILPKPTVAPQPTVAVLGESRTPAAAPLTPINLKYYGYVISKTDGRKEACLLDGEDIILATENETVKQRYKIVHIALNSIDIEDTQAKNTQTLKFQDLPSS